MLQRAASDYRTLISSGLFLEGVIILKIKKKKILTPAITTPFVFKIILKVIIKVIIKVILMWK